MQAIILFSLILTTIYFLTRRDKNLYAARFDGSGIWGVFDNGKLIHACKNFDEAVEFLK